MNADWKVDKAQYAEFNLPTCGKIAVWQLCRERQPWWNSHDGPELKMLGSMPWCSFPWHNLLPRLVQKNCCINLIDEFTSWVSPKATIAGSLRKAFLQKHAFVDISVFPPLGKQQPRFAQGQPMGYFQLKKLDIKNFIEPLKLLSQWMTGGESWMTPCTNMCPYVPACANIAVCQLCRERQPLVEQSWWAWTENAWINAMVFVPMAQSPPKAGSKELLYKFDRWVYILGFAEGNYCRFA